MKKALRIVSIALVIIIVGAMLASCSKMLMGTYSGSGSLFGVAGGTITYKFSGSSVTTTITAEILGFSKTTEYTGKYEIKAAEDGKETITFTYEGDGSSYSGTSSFAQGKNDTGTYIEIDGAKYYKK